MQKYHQQLAVLAWEKKGSKKDLIIDPANKKEVDEAIKSGSTLTDEAADLS